MNIAFTICSANYLPFAKSLADSLVQHNPRYQFIIALADTYQAYNPAFFLPHQVIPVPDMAIPHFEEMNSRYNIFELSCALKPFVARYILNQHPDCNQLFYFDSDILLFDALTEAETVLQYSSILITPHIIEAPSYDQKIALELDLLCSGVFNAGFWAIQKNEESAGFLQWWEDRLRYHCFDKASPGLFVDQAWLDFVPMYFENACVFRNPGYNVAYWNFSERKVRSNGNSYIVNDQFPLVFFHYSGYNIQEPDIISKHTRSLSLQQMPEYIPLYDEYRQKMFGNNTPNYLQLPVALGKKPQAASRKKWRKKFWKLKW